MISKLDLAAMAEGTESPYRPIPLANTQELEASLFICQGRRPWNRKVPHDELLLVLEGVITLEGPNGKIVINEGDVALAPRTASYSAHSGMRSSVVLLEAVEAKATSRNGHSTEPGEGPGAVSRIPAAADAVSGSHFDWSEVAHVGRHLVRASRIVGSSLPYRVDDGAVFVIVFRGVMNVALNGETGSLVGSQMLVAQEGSELTLSSERGATVIFVSPADAPVPEVALSGSASAD